jgi:hypothetical protein
MVLQMVPQMVQELSGKELLVVGVEEQEQEMENQVQEVQQVPGEQEEQAGRIIVLLEAAGVFMVVAGEQGIIYPVLIHQEVVVRVML